MTQPAVVLSGGIAALALVRQLGRSGVPSVVVHYLPADNAQESRYCRRRVWSPHPDHDEPGFIDALLSLGKSVEGSPLFPASDEALVAVARHRSVLEQWYRVAAPPADLVEQVIRKEHTYRLGEAIGVRVPKTELVQDEDHLIALLAESGYPCLIKPSQSHRYVEAFGRKMVRVEDLRSALAAYREAREASLQVMLQELIPGDDGQGVNYNSYRVEGDPVVEFTARKVRLAPHSFGPPSVVVSRRVAEVVEPGRAILAALGLNGYSCVEFKRDARSGQYVLMEVNARFNLSSLLAERCGWNIARLAYDDLIGEPVERLPGLQREGLYWIDGTKDLMYALQDVIRHPPTVAGTLRPYLHPKVFAVFDSTDRRPFAKRLTALASRAGRAARERLWSLRRDMDSDSPPA